MSPFNLVSLISVLCGLRLRVIVDSSMFYLVRFRGQARVNFQTSTGYKIGVFFSSLFAVNRMALSLSLLRYEPLIMATVVFVTQSSRAFSAVNRLPQVAKSDPE